MFSLAFFEDHTSFQDSRPDLCLYGLHQCHRRHALLTATDDPAAWVSPGAPAVVVALFTAMIGLMVLYAVLSHQSLHGQTTVTARAGGAR